MDIDKDPSDQTQQASDTSAQDKASDKLQDAARGGGPSSSAVQAAQNLTGANLLADIMQWQNQVTSLPSQTDPNGNVVAFNTKQWTEEHYEKADELHKQIPNRMQIFGLKTQMANKDIAKIKSIEELDSNT
jgi:hypothetical protein